jgi:hypothetical protein
MKKHFFYLFIFAVAVACKKKSNSSINATMEIIPGSKFHEQNATWWGYNQQKIVRYGNLVFMTVVENDNLSLGLPNASNPSTCFLYAKNFNGPWTKGAGVPCSRPANILVDSKGGIHLIVFQPTEVDPSENGSLGALLHYHFPHANHGDINHFQLDTIVSHSQGQPETVNIRVGASISTDDIIYAAFGLFQDVKVCSKHIEDPTWAEEWAGQNLGNSYYYPFVLSGVQGTQILAVQDDYVGPGLPAQYYKNKWFQRVNGNWTNQTVCDLSTHPLAAERNQLVDNCELYEGSDQTIYGIYQKKLHPVDSWKSSHHLLTHMGGQFQEQVLDFQDENMNRVRMFEYNNTLYFIGISYSELKIMKGINGPIRKINVPDFDSGNYLYIASPSNGSPRNAKFIDLLMLNGNSASYPNAKNYYLRICTSQLEAW